MIRAGSNPAAESGRKQRLPGAVFVFRFFALATLSLLATGCEAREPATEEGQIYTIGRASRDGIGKFYMGREISHVMGHLGAGWLERPGREREERTDLLLANLDLGPESVAADVGAGTGYFALPMASRAKKGKVYASDLQPEMLEILTNRARAAGITNVIPVQATETDPGLPDNSIDLVLLVDAYHEFNHPFEVMSAIYSSLKPGGQVVLIEYRGEDPAIMIKPLHKMTEQQAIKELSAVGLVWEKTLGFLPQQHYMVFRKPAG